MKILTLPLDLMKQAFAKIQIFFFGIDDLLGDLMHPNSKYRPSRMYRLLFPKSLETKKIVQEQYVVEEPEYYGNYE